MSAELFDRVVCQPGVRGLYESHYLKAHGGTRRAFWIKYCVLAPKASGAPAVMEFWAVVWPDDGAPIVVKRVVALESMTVRRDALRIDGEGMFLDATRARGSITEGGHTLAWDLALRDTEAPLLHLPYARMYTAPLPKKKLLVPSPHAVFTGSLTVDGEPWAVDEWTGLRGHNWGSEHARRYAYGNCNTWSDGVARVLDGFTTKILLGPVETPWLTAFVGRDPDGALDFHTPRHWLSRASVRFPNWEVWLGNGDRTLTLQWRSRAEDMVGLHYLHPDGKLSYCYNTRFAKLDATLTRGRESRHFSSERAELEFLFPTPVEGIAMHGNTTLIAPHGAEP